MRRLAIALLALGAGAAVLAAGGVANAQQEAPAVPPVDVVEVNGIFDDVVYDFVSTSIDRAATDGAQAVVLQMNTKDAVISRERMTRLAEQIAASPVPVTIWVGPSGARGYRLPGQLLAAAAVTGMAPGARIGNFGDYLSPQGVTMEFGSATDFLRDGTLGAAEARQQGALKLGVDDRGTPTLGDFLVVLDGFTYRGTTLETAEVVEKDGQLRRQPTAQPRFSKPELVDRLFHTVASPPVAYLLLVIGMSLLVFEFFTAGVGVAGVVGALCVILGMYGAAELPTRPWALLLLVGSMLAFAIDVQTGIPRFWTGVGTLAFVLASVALFDGFPLSWITLLVGIGGVLLAFVAGMPAMVRTRFATPTIGREWMVGEMGEAVSAVDPEGVVSVRGATWPARTNRATPIAAGAVIRVAAIDGTILEVEPEEGAAKDYRERARARGVEGDRSPALTSDDAT